MYQIIKNYCDQLASSFNEIEENRKLILNKLVNYIQEKINANQPISLIYICTHNSRRSHFGQIWAKMAAVYYGINNLETFSGGTEVTAFNPNAIQAIKEIGFQVNVETEGKNPLYRVYYTDENYIRCFSKVFSDSENPDANFAAVMTCSEAEDACPFVPGASVRISTTYEDPKIFDNTPQKHEKYAERCRQIALETFYAFSLLKNK